MSSWFLNRCLKSLCVIGFIALSAHTLAVEGESESMAATLDLDGNGKYEALTDGLLLLRGLFGLTGDGLINGAVGSNAVYTTSADIEERINSTGMMADIDNDGSINPLTDGIIFLRYLFGLRGNALTDGAVGADAKRTESYEVEQYLSSMMPSQTQETDTKIPVITLVGANPQTVQLNARYSEAGANTDTGESVEIDDSSVNTSAVGSYIVFYSLSDTAGNTAAPVTRTINVVAPAGVVSEHSVLSSIVDNIVIPNYKVLSDQAAAFAADSGPLASYCDAVGATDEDVKLASAKASWKTLMRTVQRTELHIIGPAAKNKKSLRQRVHFYNESEQVSTCATDVAVVKANSISDFDVAETTGNQRSMSAVEYLLFNNTLTHTCSSGVSTVSGWNELSESERKKQRCALGEVLARDVSLNATKIHRDWGVYRSSFLDASEIGTNFEFLTDGLFYFEKYTKSAKLTVPLGIDPLCSSRTCPESIESPFSDMSLDNIKTNSEQLLEIFDGGLDDLADKNSEGWSTGFKALITAVVDKSGSMLDDGSELSLKQRVAEINSDSATSACENAYNNPDSNANPQICTLGGMVKRVTDQLKVEFVVYLGVSVPGSVQGDND